ncbi:MAG: transcriptional repressor [Myxococcales bacterium]|nr:transcriptional repressor [Myxococcales bacterium]
MAPLDEVRQEIRALLRKQGLRATAPRIAVLVALHECKRPMTHEQVMGSLPDGAFDKATVWRILADLADQQLLRRMDLGDRVWRYELFDACRPIDDDHAHFLCDTCGDVSCLPPLELRARDGGLPEMLRGADVQLHVRGTCAVCTAAK